MFKQIFLLSSVLCYSFQSMAGQLTTTVEPEQISYGETLQYNVIYEGDDAGAVQPDFSALQTDFTVYSTSSSMQSSFVNGIGRQKRAWTLLMRPKTEGKLQIPAITVGTEKTKPQTVEVLPASQNVPILAGQQPKVPQYQQTKNKSQTSTQKQNFWAEMSVANKKPYIGQVISGTVYIYDNIGLNLRREPMFDNIDDWNIMQVNSNNPLVVNRQNQRVIAYNYLFEPKKSGKLKLPQAVVYASYVDTSKIPMIDSIDKLLSNFSFNISTGGLMATEVPVQLETKPIDIEVQPIPEDYGDYWWLPANALQLEAKWVDKNPVFKVGEAVTREIVITASGASEEQMPKIKFNNNAVWKQYPEKTQINVGINDNQVFLQATTRVVYIPQKSGDQELAEIKLRWFNVKTKHIETAVIPAEKIYVADAEKSSKATLDEEEETSLNEPVKKYEPQTFSEYDNTTNREVENLTQKIKLGILLALAFAAGLLFSFWAFKRRVNVDKATSQAEIIKQVKQCLRADDYRGLRDALLYLGEQTFGEENVNNLNDLSKLVNVDDFTEQMHLLNANLYTDKKSKLNEKVILSAFEKRRLKDKQKLQQPLPDLYK